MKKIAVIIVICMMIAGCATHDDTHAKKEQYKPVADAPVASVLPPPEK